MPTKIIREPTHIPALVRILMERKLPITVSWTQGASLTSQQQRLSFRWYADISRQLGDMTPEQVRADCKVTHGIPILSAEDDAFRETWERGIGRFDYAGQRRIVELMQMPVTSLMKLPQMTVQCSVSGSTL